MSNDNSAAQLTEIDGVEWGAKWSDGGYCPASPPRSEDFARKHAHSFGTRPIRRSVGPWVYADTGEHVFPEQVDPATSATERQGS